MKKIILLAICLVMALCLVPTAVMADNAEPIAEVFDENGNSLGQFTDWLPAISKCKQQSGAPVTIKLLADVTLPSNFNNGNGNGLVTVTLDLNNHVLNGGNTYGILNSGILTITDSSAKDSVHYWVADDNGLWIIQEDYNTSGKTENVDYYKTTGGCITNLKAPTVYYSTSRFGTINNQGSLTVTGVDLIGNNGGMGGALYNYEGKYTINSEESGIEATLTDCNIMGNVADIAGGIANKGTLTVKNCRIAYNTAKMEVGGIYNDDELILEDTEITNNVSNGQDDVKGDVGANKYPSAGVYSFFSDEDEEKEDYYRTSVALKGKVVITDNKSLTDDEKYIDANLIDAENIDVDAQALTAGSNIGVTKLTGRESDEEGGDLPIYGTVVTVCDESALNYFHADDEDSIVYYVDGTLELAEAVNVEFNTNGGSKIETKRIALGTIVTEPAKPTKDGYVFDGWFTDAACQNKFDFKTAISEDTVLFAKWTAVPVVEPVPVPPTGDMNVLLYAVIALASVMGIALTGAAVKKNKQF